MNFSIFIIRLIISQSINNTFRILFQSRLNIILRKSEHWRVRVLSIYKYKQIQANEFNN